MKKDLSWLRTLPGSPLIVAEIKLRSPYGWVSPISIEEQFEIALQWADILSVHTNPLWGGSFQALTGARANAIRGSKRILILAKGFHDTVADVQQALDFGADYVLTVGWDGGPLSSHCWQEVESTAQLRQAQYDQWIVCNARNPRTGEKRGQTLEERTISEASLARGYFGGPICQASMINGPEDVDEAADAILVGQRLYS